MEVGRISVSFGEDLRRRRLEARLTLTELAGAVHYSKGQLSKVERGVKTPSRDLARLCDAALHAGGMLAALLPARLAKEHTPERQKVKEGEWLLQLFPDGANWFQPVTRRQVVATASALHLGSGGLAVGATRALEAEGSGLLEASRSLFDHYRRMGQMAGPGLILPVIVAQTHTLRELSTRVGLRTRQQLLALAARYAEYVGWLAQETGNEEAALWWTQRAVDLAAAGGGGELAGYALVRRALVTLYREDATATVELSRRAHNDTALPHRIRGLAAQREAQGHALAGDYDASMHALDRARTLFARDRPDGSPVIGTMHLPDPVSMITGWCLHDLGRPTEAAAVLDEQLALVPPHALRTKVRYGVRQALAHATAGEIDHACELATRLLDSAATVSSATIAYDLRRLARVLARHPRNPLVRALTPKLGSSTHPTTT